MSQLVIRTNAKGEVIVPFFRVGQPEPELSAIISAVKRPTTKRK
jgi:hypothetical protein